MAGWKRVLSVILTAVLIALPIGCSDSSAAPTPPAAEEVFDLTVCLAPNPQSIDPALNVAVDGAILIQHFFEGLMKWKDDGAGNAVLTAGQAASYESVQNADGTVTYTFHLRDNIFWSDGQPVKAGDFVYAWRRLVDPATAAGYSYIEEMVTGANEILMGEADSSTLGVSATDDTTFVVNLAYDCPYFLEICAFPALMPVRQDVIEANGDQWTFRPGTYISNGIYKMEQWTQNDRIVAVPNEYHYDAANLGPDSITFRLMDDENAIYSGFKAGELAFIESVPVEEVPSLLANGTMTAADNLGSYFVCFQNQKAPFDDARVREAFTLVIDSVYLVNSVTQSGETPAAGLVPYGVYDTGGPGSEDFRTVGGGYWQVPESEEVYRQNCDKARVLLAEAGYPGGAGFPPVEYLYSTDGRNQLIAEAMQSMWKNELGVTVRLVNEDWASVLQSCFEGDYDMACGVWNADYNDPASFLDLWQTDAGNNIAFYSNPAFDQAVARAASSGASDERMAALHEAEDLLIGQDYALAPIFFYTYCYCADPALKGIYYNPLGYFFFGYTSMES